MQRPFTSAVLALAIGLASTAALAAPTEKQQNGIAYVNGGVGQEEQTAMRAVRADYNLQLTFANAQSGEYRSDVRVDIMDAKGASLLSAANAGPMFFAKLQPGTYRISAAAQDKTFKRTVKVGGAPKAMTLHWDKDSQEDPGEAAQ
ncbi:carboxypeptidase regulatory-like domain-containing protein [Massilia forsythiae]|uniref:Carboxypeptidase regulatory-like domain-containing protein n=1 Tax=Massilia forsythiae TaxID=2728020 RepID=A0A7Z2VUW0_9BURK|nr:carboxypeptidase regulatory-like domain-containing protein [Massilia forsythiae]QJD99552.1 carboxypeptidase regulatory-like domain-containing protein [Massilia forsythiae]